MRIHATPEVVAELASLYERNGILNAELVVEASKRKKSPLHSLFHWGDDAEAARIGRLQIAATLIQSVTVKDVQIPGSNAKVEIRAYHGVGGGYRSLSDIVGSEELMELVLGVALRDLERMKEKYGHLKALSGVVREIDLVAASRSKKEPAIT